VKRIAACIAASLALSAAAQEDARWYLQVDNDSFFGTDRWYSSGVRVARVQREGDHAIELGILQEIYTPEAKRFEFGLVDRRPAARLLLSAARHDYTERYYQTLELAAGVRGPAAQGEAVTDAIHRLIPARDVDWSREGRNELDLQLAAVRSHALSGLRVHYGAVLGNQLAFVHGGVEWRVGEGGAREMDTPVMRFAATPPLADARLGERGWSAFAGASVRAVARNQLLDEGYDEFAAAPERRRGVGRLAAGASASFGCASVVLALAQDSREFSTQRTPQRFGSLTLHVQF
jgi:hypothetical protein